MSVRHGFKLGQSRMLTIAAIFSCVASLLNRNRPHVSSRVHMFSRLEPEKSSSETFRTCRIECEGVMLNFVSSDRKRMF